MILDNNTEALILTDGEVQTSTNMEIDSESHIFLMRMLSKFYSDAIGSLIRETASNALDSHRACDIDEPIIVSFTRNPSGNYEFSVEDFGCGMDDKDVENVISKYGKSTKRQSVKLLGAFGLGFKSPLAYSSSFYFIGRKDGVERKWMMYEAEDEQNKIDLLHETKTTERNGVKIIVPVKYGDNFSFQNKIKEQLAYFENVYFNCPSINNDFTIFRHQDFQYSPLCTNDELHICLDNVYYPIDFTKLGIGSVRIPLGLRFGLSDGLFPVPNREQLKYTPEAKTIILDRIKKLSEFLVTKYNEKVNEVDDFITIVDYYRGKEKVINDVIPQIPITLNNGVLSFSSIKALQPELKGIKKINIHRLVNIREYLLQEYFVKFFYQNKRFTSLGARRYNKLNWHNVENGRIYVYSDTLTKEKQDYLRDILPRYKRVNVVKKEKDIKLGKITYGTNYDNYVALLELQKVPKVEWRERIKELQYVISLITSTFVDLDKMEIPKEWIESRKKARKEALALLKEGVVKRVKLEGEITAKLALRLEKYSGGKNCKFQQCTFNLKDLYKDKFLTIYCENIEENEDLIQKWFSVLRKDNIRFVTLSSREMKKIKDLNVHNWIKMEDFVKGNHKVFKRAATAYLIYQLKKENIAVFNKIDTIKLISTDLSNKLTQLDEYNNKYYLSGSIELYESILKLAEENKLFDPKIYSIYKEVKKVLEKLVFLNPILESITRYTITEGVLNAIMDLFKYYKQKMDWQNYKLHINEEVITKEQVENI